LRIAYLGRGQALLSRNLESLHIEQFAAYNALGEISEKAHVVIWLDAVEPKHQSIIVFDFPGGTVADLLDMFVVASPNHSWSETRSGVIHVVRDAAQVSLLDVVISYSGGIKKTRHEIWEDLAKRPEISEWMHSHACERGEVFNGSEFRNHNDPISIESGSLTLAELLDRAAVKSGVDYWTVLQSPPDTPCRIQIIL
jgi:hypothetical protein